MSTDYGLHCRVCNESYIPAEMREYQAQELLENIHLLLSAHKLSNQVIASVIEIKVDFYGTYFDHDDFFEWVEKHIEHGFILADEYGRTYP